MRRSALPLAIATLVSPLLLSMPQKPDEPRPAATPEASGTFSSSGGAARDAAATPTPHPKKRRAPRRRATATPGATSPAATPQARGGEPDRSPSAGDSSRPMPARTPTKGELPHTGREPEHIDRTPPAVDESPKPPADEDAPSVPPSPPGVARTRLLRTR